MRTWRQRMGQHFLRDERVARDIAAALPVGPRVLEVGPGRGALTSHLLGRFPVVRVVELDAALADRLAGRLGWPAGLEVRRGDALDDDLDELAAGGPWPVAGNLPYSVGTAIVRRLLRRGDLFPAAVVMVQEEVAERLVAGAGSSSRGLISLEVELFAAAELLFSVSPRAFEPPPRVRSAVVRLRLRSPEEVSPDAGRALEIAGTAFAHRRKKLRNALADEGYEEDVAFDGHREWREARPQELPAAAWLELATAMPERRGARR